MRKFSRREFLKIGAAAGLSAAYLSTPRVARAYLPEFPTETNLGRLFHTTEIKAKPNPDSATVESLYEDQVVEWHREVIGEAPSLYSTNRKWVETANGYVPSISVQPVKAILNSPVAELPAASEGKGFWAEVTVPYVDIQLANPPGRAPLLADWTNPRFYYSQIFWVDDLRTNDQGETEYHVIERHGSYGDTFWADARAFKPLTKEDVAPIRPEIADKKIIVDVNHQTVSCYEGNTEIRFCRVSTGAKYDMYGNVVDNWSTPLGDYHVVNRKYLSIHMAGGTAASGYELFGVCWTSIFAINGVAFHSTFWHNNYGEPMSHGCVNMTPEDSKFLYRWTMPEAPYDPGKIEVQGYSGTAVKVVEG